MPYDPTQPQLRVGVGVMILKDGKVLLRKRTSSHGAGEFAFPGGHLEYMESFEDCARRETLEECGLEIENIRFQFISNLRRYKPKHYAHIGLIADWKSGEPKLLEPEKCEGGTGMISTTFQRVRLERRGLQSKLTKLAPIITMRMKRKKYVDNYIL